MDLIFQDQQKLQKKQSSGCTLDVYKRQSVHSVWALSKEGYETIIVNNNPETVSTDFDVADKDVYKRQS